MKGTPRTPSTPDSHPPASPEGGHGHHVKHTPEEWAKKLDAKERDDWQKPDSLIALLNIVPGQTVAEIGAGTGYFLRYLSKAVGETGHVLARDVEMDLVDHMKKRIEAEGLTNVTISVCPFDHPGLPNAAVDLVLLVNTWHHISNRVDYAKKLGATLGPEGRICIVDFHKESAVGPPPDHKLSSDQIIRELTDAGLSIKIEEESLPEQYVIRAENKK